MQKLHISQAKNRLRQFAILFAGSIITSFAGFGLFSLYSSTQAFSQVCDPTNTICILGLSDNQGTGAGDQVVQITTTGLSIAQPPTQVDTDDNMSIMTLSASTDPLTITFGNAEAEILDVVDNGDGTETITLKTPAHVAGPANITISTTNNSVTATDAFLYSLGIAGISPSHGSTKGGASIGAPTPTPPTPHLDINGNDYDAPGYNPDERASLVHTGFDFDRYQPVEYVEFTGAQYIDTGIYYLTTDDIIKMEIDVEYTESPPAPKEEVTGLRATSSALLWRLFITYYTNNIYATGGSHSTGSGVNLGTQDNTRKQLGIQYDRVSNGGQYMGFLNGAPLSTVRAMTPPEDDLGNPVDVGPFYIGAAKDSSGPNYFSNYKMYRFTIEKEGIPVANYEPVWDIITNKYGMLDSVSGQFLGNASPTSDLVGPVDVNGDPVDANGNPLLTTLATVPTVEFKIGNTIVGTCDSVVVISGTDLTCIPSAWDDNSGATPTPTTSQAVDVFVSLNSEDATLPGGYTYRAPMSVSAISPDNGPTTGGNNITISGINLITPNLQSDYAVLEYAEFTGSQYIDTGIFYQTTDENITMELDATFVPPFNVTGVNEQLTGLRATTYGTNLVWRFFISSYSNNLYVAAGSNATTAGINLGPQILDSRRLVGMSYTRTSITTGEYVGSIDGVQDPTVKSMAPPQNGSGQPVAVGPFYLGAAKDTSGANYYSKYQVYGFKLVKDGNTVADYIPVRNVITGEIGFWDNVSRSFKSNGGAPPLIAGPVKIGPGASRILNVTIGGEVCDVVSATETAITCTVPSNPVGIYDVIVENESEIITISNTNTNNSLIGYKYTPLVSNVQTPFPNNNGTSNVGSTAGGNTLTITGAGFFDDTPNLPTVMVGDVPCGNVVVNSATELTCDIPLQSPEHSPGTVNVIVTIDGIGSLPLTTDATSDDYIFREPMRVISISPNQGPIEGGTQVFIAGASLLPPNGASETTVVFDPDGTPTPCVVFSWTDTELICTTGSHMFETVDVKLTNSFETTTVNDGFRYVSMILSLSSTDPTITILTPGTEETATSTYKVKTNYEGYTLSIHADNTDIEATGACVSSGAKFSSISTASTTLGDNTWGWKVSGASSWQPMTSSLSLQTIHQQNTTSGNGGHDYDSFDVVFGAKSDYTQPACDYETEVIITVTAKD